MRQAMSLRIITIYRALKQAGQTLSVESGLRIITIYRALKQVGDMDTDARGLRIITIYRALKPSIVSPIPQNAV